MTPRLHGLVEEIDGKLAAAMTAGVLAILDLGWDIYFVTVE